MSRWINTINGKLKVCYIIAFKVVPDILYSHYSKAGGPYIVKAITKGGNEYTLDYVNSVEEGEKLIEKIVEEVNDDSEENMRECKTPNEGV